VEDKQRIKMLPFVSEVLTAPFGTDGKEGKIAASECRMKIGKIWTRNVKTCNAEDWKNVENQR
jgi:hypothetical protein